MRTLNQEVRIAFTKMVAAQTAFDNRTGKDPKLGRALSAARDAYQKLKQEQDRE